ncbi:12944_t:CDS:2, partial [Acaulospora morrowiae]
VMTRNSRKELAAASNSEDNNNEISKVKDIRQWFAQLNVDFEQITDIVQEMISLYALWEEKEKPREIQEILQKLLKK